MPTHEPSCHYVSVEPRRPWRFQDVFAGVLLVLLSLPILLGCGGDGPAQLKKSLESLGCEVAVRHKVWYVHTVPSSRSRWQQIVDICRDVPQLCITVEAINDEDLSLLEPLHNVVGLLLFNDRFSDAAMTHISRLDNLELLGVGGSPITDNGVAAITKLRHLRTLDLRRTHVTDDGLKHVAQCVNLQTLLLGRTGITDRGIKHCGELSHLTDLDLYGTRITDGCIKDLARLASLRQLNVASTGFTSAGAKRLSKSLPDCKLVVKGRVDLSSDDKAQ